MLAQEDVFRVDVRLVRLLVTVKDQNGQRVGSLERPDFKFTTMARPRKYRYLSGIRNSRYRFRC